MQTSFTLPLLRQMFPLSTQSQSTACYIYIYIYIEQGTNHCFLAANVRPVLFCRAAGTSCRSAAAGKLCLNLPFQQHPDTWNYSCCQNTPVCSFLTQTAGKRSGERDTLPSVKF